MSARSFALCRLSCCTRLGAGLKRSLKLCLLKLHSADGEARGFLSLAVGTAQHCVQTRIAGLAVEVLELLERAHVIARVTCGPILRQLAFRVLRGVAVPMCTMLSGVLRTCWKGV